MTTLSAAAAKPPNIYQAMSMVNTFILCVREAQDILNKDALTFMSIPAALRTTRRAVSTCRASIHHPYHPGLLRAQMEGYSQPETIIRAM